MHNEKPTRKPDRSIPKDPAQILNAIVSHPQYLELASQSSSSTEAISWAARLAYEKQPDGPHSVPLRLLAITPEYTVAQSRLDDLRSRGGNKQEIIDEKIKVIKFNHQLRDIVDHNPRLGVNDLLSFVESSMMTLEGATAARQARSSVSNTLHGMRHELAFEGLLYHLTDYGVVYDENDKAPEDLIKEELTGIDLVVNYKGQPLAIDVKASVESAQKKQQKNLLNNSPKLAIWSQFNTRDLGPTLRPQYDQSMIEQKAGAVLAEFEQAHQNNQSVNSRSRNIGAQAVRQFN